MKLCRWALIIILSHTQHILIERNTASIHQNKALISGVATRHTASISGNPFLKENW